MYRGYDYYLGPSYTDSFERSSPIFFFIDNIEHELDYDENKGVVKNILYTVFCLVVSCFLGYFFYGMLVLFLMGMSRGLIHIFENKYNNTYDSTDSIYYEDIVIPYLTISVIILWVVYWNINLFSHLFY